MAEGQWLPPVQAAEAAAAVDKDLACNLLASAIAADVARNSAIVGSHAAFQHLSPDVMFKVRRVFAPATSYSVTGKLACSSGRCAVPDPL